jgi:hypothetical protein
MSFPEALRDYRYLRNRGFPEKASLKLVADRWRLPTLERNCLFRSVFPEADCRLRRAKLIAPQTVGGQALGVDWYNVLITVESYLKGYPVFLADDGLLRDSSGVHGSYRPGKVTEAAIGRILQTVSRLRPARLELFLDAPISFSGAMAEELRRRAPGCPCDCDCDCDCQVTVSPSADYPLKSFPGVVATSDSSIIDREAIRKVVDLARIVLESGYGARVVPVEEVFIPPTARG